MKQKFKLVNKEVEYLVNARPTFVSIVDHGANQVPFAVLKRHQKGEQPMPKNVKKKVKLRLVRKGSRFASVRKLSFDKSVFATEQAVNDWLVKNNWEDFVITDSGKVFEASSKDATDSVFKNVQGVDLNEPGVTGFVGEVDPNDVEDEEETPTNEDEVVEGDDSVAGGEDTTEKVSKYDLWSAYMASDTELAGVIRSGMSDGMPPGVDNVFSAAFVAMANTLKSDMKYNKKKDAIKKVAEDMATIVTMTYDAYSELLDKNTDAAKKFVGEYDSFIEKYATDTAANVSTGDDKLSIVLSAIGELKGVIAGITTELDSVKKTAAEAKDAAAKSATELADTIKKKAPEKKASHIDDTRISGKTAVDQADDLINKRFQADILGLRSVN